MRFANRGCTFLNNADGERQNHKRSLKCVPGLENEPFRRLCRELRCAGGFAKDVTPSSEFLWADVLRRRTKRELANEHPEDKLDAAIKFAKSRDAAYLPGSCGPVTG